MIEIYDLKQRIKFPPKFKYAAIQPNDTGLAHWAGTSFATPLAAAVFAANLVKNWNPAGTSFEDTRAVLRQSLTDKTAALEPAIPLK